MITTLFEKINGFQPANSFKILTSIKIGLNLLTAHSESEKVQLSSDLIGLFKRFATSRGDQMTSVLGNAVNTILESKRIGTRYQKGLSG